MKVKELIDGLSKYPDHLDDTITIEKHDKNQLCCSATVPVKGWQFGFDWEHNQTILKPEIDLCTSWDVMEKQLHDSLEKMSNRLINNTTVASRMHRLIESDMKDDDPLKKKLQDMLKGMINSVYN